jgi:hypothetical protein
MHGTAHTEHVPSSLFVFDVRQSVKNVPWHLITVKANYWWLSTTKTYITVENIVNKNSLNKKYSEIFRESHKSLNISG